MRDANAGPPPRPDGSPAARPPQLMSFGVFSPRGYVLLAFGTAADAAQARDALLTGGYEAADVMAFGAEEVLAGIARTLPERGVLSWLGEEREAVDRHREAAEQGAAFLLVYAPSADEAARVMNVARRGDVRLAQHYGRMTVTDLR